MNEKWNSFTKNIFKVGTPECAIFFALVAMVLALLFLALGFWQTLLIVVLVLLGLFIGGVKDKKAFLGSLVNKIFPPKQNVPYRARNEQIERAVKEAREAQKASEASEAQAEAPAEETEDQQ